MRRFFTWLIVGVIVFIAYMCWARAGRTLCHEIKATLDTVWNDPRVKKARKQAVKQVEKEKGR